MLANEVDGDVHVRRQEYDIQRQQKLESLRVTVLRFDVMDVLYQSEIVVNNVKKWIDENAVHKKR